MREHWKNVTAQLRRKSKSWIKKAKKTVKSLGEGWRHHRDRLRDPEYVEAVYAVILTTVELVARGPRARYIAQQLLTAYIAVHRAFGAQPPDPWPTGSSCAWDHAQDDDWPEQKGEGWPYPA